MKKNSTSKPKKTNLQQGSNHSLIKPKHQGCQWLHHKVKIATLTFDFLHDVFLPHLHLKSNPFVMCQYKFFHDLFPCGQKIVLPMHSLMTNDIWSPVSRTLLQQGSSGIRNNDTFTFATKLKGSILNLLGLFSIEYCKTKTKTITYQLHYSANLKLQ